MIISETSRQTAIQRFGGKRDLYEKALIIFARDLPDTWQPFEEIGDNLEETRQEIHKIKGVAGNLALDEIFELSRDFELSIKEEHPDPGLYAALSAACTEYKREILPASVDVADAEHREGSREEFYDCLYRMKEALEEYDLKACAETAKQLSGVKWQIYEQTAQKLNVLCKLIDDYEYDKALDLINAM